MKRAAVLQPAAMTLKRTANSSTGVAAGRREEQAAYRGR
jgi:hypothetical protein